MKTEELSTITIDEVLKKTNLPDNFEKLSSKRQKEIIFNTVLATYKKLAETLEFKHKAEEAKKKLSRQLKQSTDGVKLEKIKKQLKNTQYEELVLLERYNGMRQLIAAMGFDKKFLSEPEINNS